MNYTPEDLKNAWNANRGEMLACDTLEVKQRRSLATAALRKVPDLKRWVAAIQRAAGSDFCTGKVEGREGQSPFLASFDWLLRWETLTLIEEGQFDRRGPKPVEPPPTQSPQKDSSYWDGPKPVFGKFSPEVTRALERAAARVLAIERETKTKVLRFRQMAIINEEIGADAPAPMNVVQIREPEVEVEVEVEEVEMEEQPSLFLEEEEKV